MRKRWPIFTFLQLWELWSVMSTDFPHDSFRIYTAFLLFEILEPVWESGTHFPWHIWSYMRRKDPSAISCSTEYWQKAIKSSAEWILPSSPPPTLHTTPQTRKLVMHPPSGHGLLAWWNNQGHGLLPLCLQLQDTLGTVLWEGKDPYSSVFLLQHTYYQFSGRGSVANLLRALGQLITLF